MRWFLGVKLAINDREFFLRPLKGTAPRPMVEHSKKDDFWAATLGKRGALRDQAQALKAAGREEGSRRVEPLQIHDFLLDDQPIRTLDLRLIPAAI